METMKLVLILVAMIVFFAIGWQNGVKTGFRHGKVQRTLDIAESCDRNYGFVLITPSEDVVFLCVRAEDEKSQNFRPLKRENRLGT